MCLVSKRVRENHFCFLEKKFFNNFLFEANLFFFVFYNLLESPNSIYVPRKKKEKEAERAARLKPKHIFFYGPVR
jgi:hypothetical protein